MSIKITKGPLKVKSNQVYFCLQGKLQFHNLALVETSQKALTLFKKKVLTQTDVQDNAYLISEIGQPPGLDSLDSLRLATQKAVAQAIARKWKSLEIPLDSAAPEEVYAIVEGIKFGLYSFTKHKSKPAPANIKINLSISPALHKLVAKQIPKSIAVMDAVDICRDLVNEPGGDLTPQIYTKKIQTLFKGHKKVSLKIRNKAQLEKEGFNGLITVGRGGPNPPVMVTLNYEPSQAAKTKKLALVGKGVTFDTGGLSLKPSSGMWEMRMDMGGSATALGAFKAIVDLNLPIRVVCVLCLTENRPGENAVLPGDIFTAKNGKTIMVDNTDAEGRLVLTDGLAEAGMHQATHIIDLATLTGAIIRSIGHSIAGVFSNNDKLTQQIVSAGVPAGEKYWAMPLEMEYRASIDDKVADLKNMGGDAGAITAGLFLQEFVPANTAWAHLDIAGTAFSTSDWKYHGWGATGWGVRSLVKLAQTLAGK